MTLLTLLRQLQKYGDGLLLLYPQFLNQSLRNFNCFSSNSAACEIWHKPSSNLYIIIKNFFNIFFGANFTQPLAKFIGLFSLLIYTLGFIQWSIIKLPKNGRNSSFSENGRY